MVSFKIQIEDMIGSVGDDQFITDSLLAVGSEILSKSSFSKLMDYSAESDIPSNGLDISERILLEVHKGNIRANKITVNNLARAENSSSIYYATTSDPVFYIKGEKVFVVADGSLTTGNLISVPIKPTTDGSTEIAHGSTSTQFFPVDAERLMVLGAASRCLKQKISTAINDEDIELTQGHLAQSQALEATYEKELQKYLT
jgi:hypothetical protein